MRNRGMSLLEVMVAVTIFILVLGVLYSISMGIINAHEIQEITVTTNDEVRRAQMVLIPRLRQAARGSINWAALPGDTVTFMMADDVDGNGFAVDVNGDIELVGPVTIQRDVNDVNGDGLTLSQLIMTNANGAQVLANGLMEGVAAGAVTVDAPPGVGFWVAPRNGGLEVTIRVEGRTVRDRLYMTEMTEVVRPRN